MVLLTSWHLNAPHTKTLWFIIYTCVRVIIILYLKPRNVFVLNDNRVQTNVVLYRTRLVGFTPEMMCTSKARVIHLYLARSNQLIWLYVKYVNVDYMIKTDV